MNPNDILVGVLLTETTTFSYIEVCDACRIPKELLIDMIEQGFFPNQPTNIEHLALDHKDLNRIKTALRLHTDLGINLAGAALALELIDEMEHMRQELDLLRKVY